MAPSEKIQVLLADEDALRLDGLASVLQGTMRFDVVAQCPDGDAALIEIRRLLPEVAVVDLNLPRIHGIELVRRIRSEGLGTKIVIMSGTTDDDVIREVVRAGGDAYLLKSGPARHLIDAISYVRDGGQYFSPQLKRDGLDRHLLEEPARTLPASTAAQDLAPDQSSEPRPSRDSRYGRSKRSTGRSGGRTSDPQRLRERLREEPDADNLEEHDYEILSMMADGIRPILDRLDEIEGRVGQMETGEEPVPSNVRGWLNNQIADTLGGRESKGDVALQKTVSDLEARLPQLIEQAVTNRFHNMAARLQQEIEETHVRTLETFVKNIQVKLVQRVSALETDMSKQADAMHQLREYSQRTEGNLSRLITGVDKLAQELPKRLAAVAPEQLPASAPELKPRRRRSSHSFSAKRFWIAVATVMIIIVAAWKLTSLKSGRKEGNLAAGATASLEGEPGKILPTPAASADIKTKLQAAQNYTERKDYAMAEDLYKQVIKTEPANAEALKALASVLYREDKIEESAAILDKLPRN